MCSNNIWGSVCGEGFSTTDAYVICRQIGLGQSGIFASLALYILIPMLIEPTVFTNSYFGDGNEAIIFSNFGCEGYEENIAQCRKDGYGTFTCSRSNAVGIICRDSKLNF